MNKPTPTPTLTHTASPDASRPRFHESAMAQVQGLASYIDDLPLIEGTLHAAPLMSPVANARVLNTDLSATLAAPAWWGWSRRKTFRATRCWPLMFMTS